MTQDTPSYRFKYTWTHVIPVVQVVAIVGMLNVQWSTWGINLEHPEHMKWLLVLPLMVTLLIATFRWKAKVTHELGDPALVRAMSSTHSDKKTLLRNVLMVLAVACIILAACRPQWGQTESIVKRSGVDIVFALDLSKSMLAKDTPPSRLQSAKQEIRTTLEMLGGDRVGLVVFTAVSFAQSPLTSDYGAMRFYLKKLNPSQMPFGGTSVGRAIQDSIELLTGTNSQTQLYTSSPQHTKQSDSTPTMKRAKTQVIVLITDGEDHESQPLTAAKSAAVHGIHVVTVGFGSAQGSRIPVYRNDGSLSGYKRNKNGEFVYTRLDSTTLAKMAALTDGIYIPYEGENSVANELVRYVNALEKSELEAMMRRRYKDRFMWFLGPGMLFLLLSMLVGVRRKGSHVQLFTTMGLIFALASGCTGALEAEHPLVQDGNEAIEKKEFDRALDLYRRAQNDLPQDPRLSFNLGRAYMGLKDHDKAQEAFARALQTSDDALRFETLYNLGLVLSAKDALKEAHSTLKQSIELYHSAIDPKDPKLAAAYNDAVHNLEVVHHKLFPPCKTFEDDFEPNDDATKVKTLDKLEVKDGVLCGGNDDWFAIPALVGTQIEVSVTFEPLREDKDPEYVFLPSPQDLSISLIDGLGQRVLVTDKGSTQAPIDPKAPNTTRVIQTFTITPQMLPAKTKALMLKLQAKPGLEYRYDLNIKAIPPCSSMDDSFEDNGTKAQAKRLDPGSHQLHLCEEDEDWYSIRLDLGDTLFVDIQPTEDPQQKAPPQLDMEIVDASTGRVVAKSKPESGLLTAGVWEVGQAGDYLVRVRGKTASTQGPYAMQTYVYAPCPIGNDRYESNDLAERASLLDAKMPMHRYLRLCPDDQDYFKLPTNPPAPQDKKKAKDAKPAPPALSVGLAAVFPPSQSKAARQQHLLDREALSFDLLSETGDAILAESMNTQPKGSKEPTDGSINVHKIIQQETLETEQAMLRVQGQAQFYHIIQLSPPPKSEQEKKEEQDDKQKKDQKQDDAKKDQGDDGEEKKDPDGKPEDQNQDPDQKKNDDQKGDEQKGDDKSKGDPSKDEKTKPEGQDGDKPKDTPEGKTKDPDAKPGDKPKGEKKQDGQPNKDQKGESKQEQSGGDKPGEEAKKAKGAGDKKAKVDPEMKRIDDILRALEESDDNFQMRKALENTPGRYIEKDW